MTKVAFPVTPQLAEWLQKEGLVPRRRIKIHDTAYHQMFVACLRHHPEYTFEEAKEWAIFSAATHPNFRQRKLSRWVIIGIVAVAVVLFLLLMADLAKAYPEPQFNVVNLRQNLDALILRPPIFAQGAGGFVTANSHMMFFNGTSWVAVTSGAPFPITCISGCGSGAGGTSSSFGAAFPATGTAIGVKNGSNMTNLTADASGNLNVNLNANSFGSLAVTGTFFQATQPISCASAATCPVNASQVGGPWTQNVTQVGGVAISEGQNVGANSIPVVLASDQSTLKVAVQNSPLNQNVTVTNSQFTPIPVLQANGSVNPWNVNVQNFPASQNVAVSNLPVTQAVSQSGNWQVYVQNPAVNQSVTVANSTFNPVKVVNQAPTIVYVLANGILTPAYLVEGQATMAQSVPVVIASNQSNIPITVGSGAGVGLDAGGTLYTRGTGLPLQPCNPVRTTNCQHF